MKSQWFQGLKSFALILFLGLSVRWGVAEAYVIPSGSMQPTLLVHDHIFVDKLSYGIRIPFSRSWIVRFSKPQRGQVVVFKDPRNTSIFMIKRVIGVPGDQISYRENHLWINGEKMETTPLSKRSGPSDFQWLKEEELEEGAHEYRIENLGSKAHSVLHSDRAEGEFGPIEVPEGSLFLMGDHRDNSSDSRVWGFAPEENIMGKAMFVWLSCEESLPGTQFGCNPVTMRWSRLFHAIR